jgi:biopolymer transport protein ExbB
LLLFLGALTSGEAAESNAAKPDRTKSLLDKYNEGGPWMHPILLCSLGAVAFSVMASLQIRKAVVLPSGLLASLRELMSTRQVLEAYQLCKGQNNPLANVMEAALVKACFERDMYNKASMEAAASEVLVHEETRVMTWVNAINICSQIAPMLGLLGTVVGMIEAFDMLAAGKAEPSDLAGGIGVAMITTAGGLLVAIPAMAAYFFFRARVISLFTELQKTAGLLLDLFTGEMTPEGHRAPIGGDAVAAYPQEGE